MKPEAKKNVPMKMRRFKTRDGGEGYDIRGTFPGPNGMNLVVSIRVNKDGCVKLVEDKRSGKPVTFASAALFKKDENNYFGRGSNKSASW